MYKNTRMTLGNRRKFRVDPARPRALLEQCPVYAPTPLHDLASLADELGVASLYVKDEAQRMRLGSFKALGGVFAVAQMISDASGTVDLMGDHARCIAMDMTFITASAGNHGLSVAAGARLFGAQAVIVLSASVPESFASRIRSFGADVVRVDGTYEDSVAFAADTARQNGWLLLADGSWEGYVERPALVMEGYTVLAEECRTEFAASGIWPTHVLLQAGVGGLAAAVAGHIREYWAEQPMIIVVEPDAAPCLLRSIKSGKLTRADGARSNMAGLDCKDASWISFEALRGDADGFLTVSDAESETATETFARHGIATTPSGAASLAALKGMALGADAQCLLIASEGHARPAEDGTAD